MTGVTVREHHLELSAFPTSPYYARVHVRRVLEGWRRDDLVETAQLAVSELVSNAIKAHAASLAALEAVALASPDRIWMDLYQAEGAIVLRVWDASRIPPVLRAPDLDDEGGRGLCLVDRAVGATICRRRAARSCGARWRPRLLPEEPFTPGKDVG